MIPPMTHSAGDLGVSVIIPAYNAAATLPLQLEALATQCDAPPFEVIVVDNGSTDDTASVVDAWTARDIPGVEIRRIGAKDLQGPGYARNVGASQARSALLMFADADDVVSRWWIAHGVRAFATAEIWTGKTIDIVESVMPDDVEAARTMMGDSGEWQPVVPGDLSYAYPIVLGGGFGCTADVYRHLGGFDVSLGTLYEDNDLGIRAHLSGIPVGHAPAVRIAYRIRSSAKHRRTLIRRASALHVLSRKRYQLPDHPLLRKPIRNAAAAGFAAAQMAVGRRTPDYEAVGDRLAASLGMLQGQFRYARRGRRPEPRPGVGM